MISYNMLPMQLTYLIWVVCTINLICLLRVQSLLDGGRALTLTRMYSMSSVESLKLTLLKQLTARAPFLQSGSYISTSDFTT